MTTERLARRDWTLIAVCVVLAALAVGVVAKYFSTAFPEAAIEFKFDRESSEQIARGVIASHAPNDSGVKHAASFESDSNARIFLERSLGLERANVVMRDQVRVWYWHHRWFKPLVEEELSVDVAPTGHVIGFHHVIPEDRAIADGDAMRAANAFLDRIQVNRNDLKLVDESQRKLPKRTQRIFTFESKSIRPADAPYRHVVTVDGDRVTGYTQGLKVPEAWLRSYRELRSKNAAAGSVDLIFNAATMIAAVVIFIARLRRGDLPLKFLLAIGFAGFVLQLGVTINSMPVQLVYYDTTTSYPAYLAQLAILGAALPAIGTAMLLIVICGAGEVLYRERLPQHLAMPRLWTRKALTSKRVFLGMILGYALVPLFMAYQVVFYLSARRIGAWAPAEVPYDTTLNTALPWVMVLFAGFFPALTEEFLSRAFSIPFFQRVFRSRMFAIVLAGFIWGFGHSTYPNQPFWIRGVEVGLVGVVAGLLMDRFGLLPLLIWHYTIDAVYTATLLFASGNTYYIVSAGLSSLIFAVPLVASIALYVRNRGFVPDDDLTNATMPVAEPPEEASEVVEEHELPPPMPVTRRRLLLCAIAIVVAAIAIAFAPPTVDDVVDYRISGTRAKEIARSVVHDSHARVIATTVEGFRYWDASSSREDGGAPGGFDDVAATYLVQHGTSIRELNRILRDELQAGLWVVRFFTPLKKEETFVEIDPRTARVIGYHKYQDERNPGPSLAQNDALAIARRAFAPYGIDPNRFDVKEALSYQQPARRDWLFHFQEKTPLTAQAYRRISVRVAGSEVTQFNKHVYVPESVRRDAEEQTLFNVVLQTLQLGGAVTLLALIVTGLIVATRAHGMRWKRALRWTLILSIIPVITTLASYEEMLFGYNTSVAWDTFRVRLLTELVTRIGMRIGLLFLAIAAIDAVGLTRFLRREGRARFGRSAAVAALTAVSLVVIARVAMQWLETLWPRAAAIGFSVSGTIATPWPSLIEAAFALMAAVILSGAIAMYTVGLRKWVAPITIAAVFAILLDPSASLAQTPRMLLQAAVAAALTWVTGRYVLNGNPLAWPLAIFVALTLAAAATLVTNHRTELVIHAAALAGFALIALVWTARSADA